MPTQFNTLCQESTLYEAWNTVKSKGSAGGIDGVTIQEFNQDKIKQIKLLQEELQIGAWKPQPYLQVSIPKTKGPNEMRTLGMAVVVKREDWVNIYPLCTECYARITYIPDIKKKEPVKIVVI